MVFGRQRCGNAFEATQDEDGQDVFLHSAEPWRAIWAAAFPKLTVKVKTEVIPRILDPESSNLWSVVWRGPQITEFQTVHLGIIIWYTKSSRRDALWQYLNIFLRPTLSRPTDAA